MLESIIIIGTIVGLIYAIIALGFTLVYGISGIVNLTHGVFIVVGAYLYGVLSDYLLKINIFPPESPYLIPIIAMFLSFIFTAAIGSIFYRLTLHQILGDEISILIASICSCLIFQKLIYITLGTSQAFAYRISPLAYGKIRIINTDVLTGQALAGTISLITFIALSIFISKTKVGRAMKALSQDLEASMLMGISTEKLYMLTTAISAGLGSLGGILYTSTVTFGVASYMWMSGLAVSFTVVVLGGLGSVKGSLLGGLILGLAEISAMTILPGAGVLQSSIPFIVIILVLIIRPKGLFGKRIEME
ncbi:MAG: branched-chain amino acid ABC transporter permease [Candidatus Bathyarchaeia archaeon]